MRWHLMAVALGFGATGRAEGPAPLAEQYLHSGDYARGEWALQRALEAKPKDDQLRFGLGVLQMARAVERLGQSLYEHGVKSDETGVPFLRLPVPKNPDPMPVTAGMVRRLFERFTLDLAQAEATLAGVTDDAVKLPLRLAGVRFDFVGDGKERSTLLDVIRKVARQGRFDFTEKNPDLLVAFDRGDVAWLRGYCHLMSAAIDGYLAFDGKHLFEISAQNHFAKPKGAAEVMSVDLLSFAIDIPEPARLHSLRLHLLAVCELNRETWRYIRTETDDDHEWLPNAMQAGVLGLPVRDAMIDGWLKGVAEFERLLRGERVVAISLDRVFPEGRGFNLKAFLDDPPARFDVSKILRDGIAAKYHSAVRENNKYDTNLLDGANQQFGNLSFMYMGWFN
jgi:hypothetical protein